jgi:hypothetical protein
MNADVLGMVWGIRRFRSAEGVTMPIPVQGVLASLNVFVWTADEGACLLLATHDHRAEETMARLALTLGFDSGATGESQVSIDDGHVTLHLPTGSSLQRPIDAAWAEMARERRQVLVEVGLLPMRAGLQAGVYADGARAAGKLRTGVLPVT